MSRDYVDAALVGGPLDGPIKTNVSILQAIDDSGHLWIYERPLGEDAPWVGRITGHANALLDPRVMAS